MKHLFIVLTLIILTVPAMESWAKKPNVDVIYTMEELEGLSIPKLPDWVDKYSDSNIGDWRYFNISKLMKRFGLKRYEAVELQNHYRDLSRADLKGNAVEHFNLALKKIRQGELESQLDLEALGKARFIVVFDLDETLYDQYYHGGEECHDIAYTKGEKTKYIELRPGWKEAMTAIHELGGAIVLFSANLDERNYANLSHWLWDGKPLFEHPYIHGFLTNSHLILQEKSEGVSKPSKGHPVVIPSKDLRIVDPSLKKVIIVDDNPKRIFQHRNLRIVQKFDADQYCSQQYPEAIRAYQGMFRVLVDELKDAVRYMDNHPKVPFIQAYLPYTSLGQVALHALVREGGMDKAKAIDFIREHPDWVSRHF